MRYHVVHRPGPTLGQKLFAASMAVSSIYGVLALVVGGWLLSSQGAFDRSPDRVAQNILALLFLSFAPGCLVLIFRGLYASFLGEG